jgi:hypothetical protein
MQPALDAFVAAGELDHLATLRDEITTIDRQEAAELSGILHAWSDPQAIANLLLYPELIPAADRLPSLLRGLAADAHDYVALAATVGVQRIDEDEIPSELRGQISAQLVRLIEQGAGPIPSRAALSMASFAHDVDAGILLHLLDSPDPAVRHNLLLALLGSLGYDQVLAQADAEVGAGRLSAATAQALRASLLEAGLDPANGPVDDELVLESPLGLPLLSYIPNYPDWSKAI